MASGRLVGAVGVALLGLLAIGCDSTRPTTSPAPSTSTSALSASQCADRIRSADLAVDDTVFAVDACRFTSAGADGATTVLGSNPTGDARWAAVWVYASSGSDAAPLRPYLTADDPSIRAMAGAALVLFGDRAGFDVLASALGDADTLLGATPPISIGTFATGAIEASVKGPGVPTDAGAWASWLSTNQAALVYDDATATWSLP